MKEDWRHTDSLRESSGNRRVPGGNDSQTGRKLTSVRQSSPPRESTTSKSTSASGSSILPAHNAALARRATALPSKSSSSGNPRAVKSGGSVRLPGAQHSNHTGRQTQADSSSTTTARKAGSALKSTQSLSAQPRPTQSGVASGRNTNRQNFDDQSTPRVRFEQQRANASPSASYPFVRHQLVGPIANLPVTARKAGSTPQSLRKQAQAVLSKPVPFYRKNATQIKPLWKMLDEDHEERSRKIKGDALGGAARRISSTSSRRTGNDNDTITISINDPGRVTARIGPGLKLTVVSANGDEAEESTGDERRNASAKRSAATGKKPQIARKSGARKTKSLDGTPPSSPDGSEMEIDSHEEEDQLEVEDEKGTHSPETLIVTSTVKRTGAKKTARALSSPDLMILDSPPPAMKRMLQAPVLKTAPKITIPLAQLKPDPENEPNDHAILYDIGKAHYIRQPSKTRVIPHDQLLEAAEALLLSPIRMQATHRLPFLRKNLRQGFTQRCESLLVPIYRDLRKGNVSLSVVYEHVGESSYESSERLDQWLCPLCTLFGEFETREMLDCHLKWDHQEVFWDWEEVVDEDEEENEQRQSWVLALTIPEIFHSSAPAIRESTFPDFPSSFRKSQQPRTPERSPTALPTTTETTPTTPTPANVISSPLPFVALSPTNTPSQRLPLPTRIARSSISPANGQVSSTTPSTVKFSLPPTPPPLTSRETSHTSTLVTTSTTTPTTATLSTVATSTSAAQTATPRPSVTQSPGPRYPTPPPRSNPRGPAAQKPYLPAYSEYGGPTVWYSCRPGGECLLDLLGTLPLEPFGLLAWEVLDREGEIFEADDIRDEYKIMHSLWTRWSILHRVEFISNYLEGTIRFVNEYWKMIHRAAGWDALRYWLLMLLAHRFLTGSDVAQVLLHYEELTGMVSWYD